MEWRTDNVGGIPLEDLPGDYFGFIYKITNKTKGRIYVGKKNFWFKRKRRYGKKEIARMEDKRARKFEYITYESDWRTYMSSSHNKELYEDFNNGDEFEKEILYLVRNENQLLYYEVKYQFIEEVLETNSYNDNISGRHYRNIFNYEQ